MQGSAGHFYPIHALCFYHADAIVSPLTRGRNACINTGGGGSIKEFDLVVSGSSIFVFVGKERKSDQIFIINVEELPGVVLVVPLSNYSRRHFPLVKKV